MSTNFSDVGFAVEFLHTVQPFNILPGDALRALAAQLEADYYPQNSKIFSSQPPPGIAIIRKGAARLLDDRHRFLDKRSEGELFGHEIYFHGEKRDYFAEAEEDCLVWRLSQENFESLCERNPQIAEYFSSHLKSRVSAAAQVAHTVSQVRDLLKREPVLVGDDISIREAAQRMSHEDVSSILVVKDGKLCGIVTDKDLRNRVLVSGLDSNQPIREVMTASPRAIEANTDVDEALLIMMRQNYHHLPVLDNDYPLGLVTAGDILRAQSEHPLRLVRDIHKKNNIKELLVLSQRLPSLFERMVNLGRGVGQIGRMVTHITDAFTVRLIELAEKKLGPAPMEYAWVVFGSQAREEQTAKTDQDNGIILDRDPDEAEASYFSELSELVCDGLDELGYVYCPGEVMALNVKWRVSLPVWKKYFDRWIDVPDPKSVMHSSIFFDIRCVHGKKVLVDKLQSHAAKRAKKDRIFRRFMAANALKHRPPLGFFRRFVQEDDGSHSEGLNLKHRGIVPITDLVRIRALEAGIHEANTFRRIDRVREMGIMNDSGQVYRDERPWHDGRVLEIAGNPLPGGGYVTTFTDITHYKHIQNELQTVNESLEHRVHQRTLELREAIEELEAARIAAEDANRSKTRFLAAASHDLLQPMNAASLFVSILRQQQEGSDDEQSRLVARIDRSLKASEQLLSALLDISKLDSGMYNPESEVISVAELFEQLRRRFKALANNRGLLLRVRSNNHLIISDRNLLNRILQNFLANAIHYTETGGVLLGCRVRGEELRISVWDTGVGIDPSEVKAIFQEFHRLDYAHRKDERGLGLGLAIVDRIARMLDHEIGVTSRVGHGSCFTVTVPLAKNADVLQSETAVSVLTDSPGLKELVILCVDNEPDILEAMNLLLDRWGCGNVMLAETQAQAAQQVLMHGTPDFVLVDYHLSDQSNGLDLMSHLDNILATRLPAIVITADRSSELEEAVKERNYGLLRKPIRPAALRALMNNMLKTQ
jgi:CBS domain-containing protein